MTQYLSVTRVISLTGDVEILPEDPERSYALVVNVSDTKAHLSLGPQPAVADKCIPLAAGGGWYEINATNLFKGSLRAISGGAAKDLLVVSW